MKAIKDCFFYGNWFYGLCAVALSIEASMQQFVPLNGILYYAAVFMITVVYYTKAYINVSSMKDSYNTRTKWYVEHKKLTIKTQWVQAILLVILSFIVGADLGTSILLLTPLEWMIILAFPLLALGYYGLGYCFNLRNNGWLKPFVIGLVWAGLVTIIPVLYYSIKHHSEFEFNARCIVLFLKNWMFVAMLCILFDIKDYAIDSNQFLETFVVQKGLRKTIFRIVIPLTIIGFMVFILYSIKNQFPIGRILINTIPFIALLIVSYTLIKRKSLLYYLSIVDGLMLLKAICGMVAILLFK